MRDTGSVTGADTSGRTYCLAILTAGSALNTLDRQLMNVLLEPVRQEFGLSDIQLGLLSGLAFAAVYTSLSIPAALLAVTHNRRNLIAAAVAVWGGMTMLCGAAQSFGQLFLTRLGVGLGEAGGAPPSHAMISDLYPPGERATAMAVWSAGINIGVFLAFLFGGLVAHRWGWRAAFVLSGGLTLLFAVLVRATVREPARTADGPPAAALRSFDQVRDSLRLMWGDPVLRQVCLGATITAIVGYGALAWIPSYLVRSHGLNIAAVGAYLAVAVGIGGAIGTALGGRFADLMRRRDIRWSLWLVAFVFIASKPFAVAFYALDDTALALALFVLPAAVGAVFVGPSLAVLHDRVPAARRPIVSAIFLLVLNFIGLGLGPLLAGAMSQLAFAAAGEGSLRYAMIAMQVFGAWGALHYYFAGRRLAAPSIY